MDTVSIEIRGKRLSIRTDHDPEYVRELSRYVDDKIKELQMMAPSAPFEKLLMLASLTLAEELFEAQGELVDIKNDLSDRTEAMLALIEEESARLGE
jgi:cell division protein ZapA (FtsZ GTPase activity inhibitor)